MAWPFHFVDLSSDEKAHRRQQLDLYALFSQLSVLIPILAYQLYRLGAWLLAEKGKINATYSALRQSPGSTKSPSGPAQLIVRRWLSVQWWLNGEVCLDLGSRGRWVTAGVWSLWLLFLCIHQTDHDYIHVTKRFGRVAAAQLPFLYLLSMRTRYSPLAIIFSTSHEKLIHWHQLCGRVIMILLALHATWYINFFVQTDILMERLRAPSSITGLISVTLLAMLSGTSLARVRQWSYRIFFFCHLAIGLAILPILLLHAKPLRVYAIEAFALFIIDRILRQMDTIIEPATIMQVPHTDLLKVQIPIPTSKLRRFQGKPGHHVYLNIPSGAGSSRIDGLLSNPFTVAEVSTTEITLVLRARQGPLTQTLRTHAEQFGTKFPISIEGPYGPSAQVIDQALKMDRIHLVAGGIGASFIIPVYRALLEQLGAEAGGPERLHFTWALKSTAEASWATDSEEQLFTQSPNVHIYVTGHHSQRQSFGGDRSTESIEMGELQLPHELVGGIKPHIGRPDLQVLVSQTFSYHAEESVAVLFCGPHDMARQLRAHVGKWVDKGRYVSWHEESFGW